VARYKKTRKIIERAREMLAEHNPMIVRQVFYQADLRGGRRFPGSCCRAGRHAGFGSERRRMSYRIPLTSQNLRARWSKLDRRDIARHERKCLAGERRGAIERDLLTMATNEWEGFSRCCATPFPLPRLRNR
jgi:hypothetical protein